MPSRGRAQRAVSRRAFAQGNGAGRAHLDRLYWKEFGATHRVYWEQLREESATRSLETTHLSIKEIGYRLGFKQASHFTKWFLRRLEMTPSQYREQVAERLASGRVLPSRAEPSKLPRFVACDLDQSRRLDRKPAAVPAVSNERSGR